MNPVHGRPKVLGLPKVARLLGHKQPGMFDHFLRAIVTPQLELIKDGLEAARHQVKVSTPSP